MEQAGPHGLDQIEFTFCANPGESLQPLARVASGGELSRLMLAMKTVLASVDQVPVLIFDEVDAGIGGNVASTMGQRLKALGHTHQVMCITHLPQIAAQGPPSLPGEEGKRGSANRGIGHPSLCRGTGRRDCTNVGWNDDYTNGEESGRRNAQRDQLRRVDRQAIISPYQWHENSQKPPKLSFLRKQESSVFLFTNEGKSKDPGSPIKDVGDDKILPDFPEKHDGHTF